MTTASLPLPASTRRATPLPHAATHSRERWRMGLEAKAMIMVTAALLAFGLATLYSASAGAAMAEGRPSWFFLWRQLTGVGVGIVAFAVAAKLDAERWRGWAWPLMGLTILLLLVVILPFTKSIAPPINGSRRFLLGGSLQPSELGKLAVVMWTAMLIVKKGGEEGLRRLSKGLLPFMVILGVLSALVVAEPDLSVVIFYAFVMGVMLFSAGARIGHFVVMGILGAPFLWTYAHKLEYVLRRILGFAAGADSAVQVNHQLQQSLIAVGSGGLFGVGFGQGRQQFGFLPLPYNDFIGSNVGEEWGFVGLGGLILLYTLWGWLGFRIAKLARSPFQQLVAIGLTSTMLVTAFLHLGVVIGLLPTTGLTLPFISYGRSNILLSLLLTGILVNIGSAKERVIGERATDPLATGR
ncbi:MAG: putative lipid II flippase FtsW [Gemmatimonadales bacterium]|nr:cell division protein FtsW [Gemmatimonadota bacterium]MCL4212839.1 putative lipid II flippase FtsW [Gemmatimonadales bacterium]